MRMADFYRQRRHFDRAASIYEHLLGAPEEGGAPPGRMSGRSGPPCGSRREVQKALADAYIELGRLCEASDLLEDLLADEGGAPSHEQTAPLFGSLLWHAASRGGPAGAVDEGPILESIGDCRFKEGRYAEAADAYRRASSACIAQQERRRLWSALPFGAGDRGRLEAILVTLLNNEASCHYAMGTGESRQRAAEVAREALRRADRAAKGAAKGTSGGTSEGRLGEVIANLRTIIDGGAAG